MQVYYDLKVVPDPDGIVPASIFGSKRCDLDSLQIGIFSISAWC
jgi:hypothetical protein